MMMVGLVVGILLGEVFLYVLIPIGILSGLYDFFNPTEERYCRYCEDRTQMRRLSDHMTSTGNKVRRYQCTDCSNTY